VVREGLRHEEDRHQPLRDHARPAADEGKFDLHFTPVEEMDRMAPYHYAIEVEDWDGFLKHLEDLGIRYTRPVERPQNNSKYSYIRDPDGTLIELVYHGDRSW
jgi:lactoylglutathione lyase